MRFLQNRKTKIRPGPNANPRQTNQMKWHRFCCRFIFFFAQVSKMHTQSKSYINLMSGCPFEKSIQFQSNNGVQCLCLHFCARIRRSFSKKALFSVFSIPNLPWASVIAGFFFILCCLCTISTTIGITVTAAATATAVMLMFDDDDVSLHHLAIV